MKISSTKLWKMITFLFKLGIGFGIILSSFVSSWSVTAEGNLPAKTGVVLHAINNQLIVPSDNLQAPAFLTRGTNNGGIVFERQDIAIPVSDGHFLEARMHKPKGVQNAPIIMYYHGGAFMEGYGSIYSHDNIVRALANRSGAIVVSVGYRLAPQHIFPKAIEDSYDALVWVHEHAENLGGDPDNIAVAGDSAGGNIATVTAMKARDLGGPNLVAQLLYYPLTTFHDHALETRDKYSSGNYLLSRAVMEKARDSYTPGKEMWENPYVSPLDAGEATDLPPAFIATAEYDPLRDEGELYAEKLFQDGVHVETMRYEGVMHGFLSFYEVMATGNTALNDSLAFLENEWAGDREATVGFRVIDREPPSGWARVKEEIEAHAAAIYLLSIQFSNVFNQMAEQADGLFQPEDRDDEFK
ncbi:alpha/beta hydrolase [Geomicrobium sp. JCM 19039]|uniref:alpha/beta hydrolase n=1 Tax=Geomicrobium sp. JCM 19039 TaxID=1460636 RepID=UPI00045F14CD|nr:alpha/beta hydrolase [Geomicrobium sp. JCM 19039]GAK11146.1 lipase [Geomicrobium sp. JCM 19039]